MRRTKDTDEQSSLNMNRMMEWQRGKLNTVKTKEQAAGGRQSKKTRKGREARAQNRNNVTLPFKSCPAWISWRGVQSFLNFL